MCAAFAAATPYLTLGGLVAFAWSGSPRAVFVFLLGVAGWPMAYEGFRRRREVRWLIGFAAVLGAEYAIVGVAAQ